MGGRRRLPDARAPGPRSVPDAGPLPRPGPLRVRAFCRRLARACVARRAARSTPSLGLRPGWSVRGTKKSPGRQGRDFGARSSDTDHRRAGRCSESLAGYSPGTVLPTLLPTRASCPDLRPRRKRPNRLGGGTGCPPQCPPYVESVQYPIPGRQNLIGPRASRTSARAASSRASGRPGGCALPSPGHGVRCKACGLVHPDP